jgi:hypothetical protein
MGGSMPQIKMAKLLMPPAEGTRSVLRHGGIPGKPLVVGRGEGKGDTDYLCGGCGVVVVRSVPAGSIRNIVFHCASCGTYSEI